MGYTRLCRVKMVETGLHWVRVGLSWFDWVILASTAFEWVSLGLSRFKWVILG